ncbi:response regulator [Pedobacter alpinus]|uniref:Response regulator n=1 Tax=Pedobacter alpinus TaxID=1590643 RepID=A0ABW5TRE7_9SPHI
MKKIELACIIDDDPIYVFCTKRIMVLADFCESFLIFHNGKEALDRLSVIIQNDEHLPEVILLDLNMPVMDGWEFLEEFTKIPVAKQITIYIVTSSIDPEDVEKAKQYDNINNYIVKPVTVEMLKEILLNFGKN